MSYTYGDTNHKHAVTMAGSDTCTYDANGNQTQRVVGGITYNLSYEAENRLVGVSGALTASFVYDGDGNRVKGTGSTSTMNVIARYYPTDTKRVAMSTTPPRCSEIEDGGGD